MGWLFPKSPSHPPLPLRESLPFPKALALAQSESDKQTSSPTLGNWEGTAFLGRGRTELGMKWSEKVLLPVVPCCFPPTERWGQGSWVSLRGKDPDGFSTPS